MSEEDNSSRETRPLSFFLARRQQQELLEQQEKRQQRIEKKREDEKKRRDSLLQSRKKTQVDRIRSDYRKVKVFLEHSQKNAVSALKILDQAPKEFRKEKELRLLANILRNMEKLNRAFEVEDDEE